MKTPKVEALKRDKMNVALISPQQIAVDHTLSFLDTRGFQVKGNANHTWK